MPFGGRRHVVEVPGDPGGDLAPPSLTAGSIAECFSRSRNLTVAVWEGDAIGQSAGSPPVRHLRRRRRPVSPGVTRT